MVNYVTKRLNDLAICSIEMKILKRLNLILSLMILHQEMLTGAFSYDYWKG
jgi:hypothetical protein